MAADVEPADAEPLLDMRGIVKTFPGVRALDGVDLVVRPGEVHCLLGQNGAGKSMLIEVLAGSANAKRWIKDGSMAATVIYPPTQAADGIRLARLIAQGKGLSDLVQLEVPKRVVLNAPVVTKDDVDEYMDLGFES